MNELRSCIIREECRAPVLSEQRKAGSQLRETTLGLRVRELQGSSQDNRGQYGTLAEIWVTYRAAGAAEGG